VRPDSNALLYLRKAMDEGKHVSCFADRFNPKAGTYAIDPGLFRLAAKTGRPHYFTRFTINQRGRVSGILMGPVDCRDPESAMGKFKAFSS
jgi:lysophospholipid acyltransferase (LPLAT)-like uncharacterized protein